MFTCVTVKSLSTTLASDYRPARPLRRTRRLRELESAERRPFDGDSPPLEAPLKRQKERSRGVFVDFFVCPGGYGDEDSMCGFTKIGQLRLGLWT